MTLEYQEIISEDPRIYTINPADFRERVLGHQLVLFDAVVSYIYIYIYIYINIYLPLL